MDNLYYCPVCGGLMEVVYDYKGASLELKEKTNILFEDTMWRYWGLLPVEDEANIVSLGEGNTPLIPMENSFLEGKGKIYFKMESVSPTGSFKDRPISVAVSKAKELGSDTIIVASSGNAAASAAAYAARAKMKCIVCIPKTTDMGKVSQAIAHGAKVVYVDGSFSKSFELAQKASEAFNWCNVTTTFINPYTVEGDKTIAYELFEQLQGKVPGAIVVPAGAGPLLVGIYKGFEDLIKLRQIEKMPKILGVQASGCAPIAEAFENKTRVKAWSKPCKTVATGICDPLRGYEADGQLTLDMIVKSGGKTITLDEHEIKKAAADLAESEGVFAEPSGATSVGALRKLIEEEYLDIDEDVVCLVTGHGLKSAAIFDCNPPVASSIEQLKEIAQN